MNVFYTNTDPVICADEHCNVHQVKMILEYAQLMSTAHHVSGTGTDDMYKKTHTNHPSAVWVRESSANYRWLYKCWLRLLVNYYNRSGKHHATARLAGVLSVDPGLPDVGPTPVRLAMPDHHHQSDPCLAYQSYLNEKFQEWLDRPRPMRVDYKESIGEPDWLNINRGSKAA